jgi:putative sterol carrier protein
VTHQFLSEEWIAAARDIRARYEDEVPEMPASIRINQVITEVPFGDGELRAYMDTSSGHLELELGELDEPDATISTDWATARALFVEQDQAVAMQAFMSGRIIVQGDIMKMLALQTAVPPNEFTERIAAEIRAITAGVSDDEDLDEERLDDE